ncbi:MAG TPA: Lrp/AsnC family transcriptional regulator [Burkholderiaceae bacterium]|nr:Lrp/AsnC family transcriptional regulator [Burkholderiaceae bacterium]
MNPPPSAPSSDPVTLDALDHRILAELQSDASLNNVELAARVHASAPTCLRRVRRLVESGVIERQVAIVAPAALGAALGAVIEVTLDAQNAEQLDRFQALAKAEAAVTQCYRVSPGPDFVLIVQVPDMPGYQAMAQRLFTAQAGVRNVRAFFVVERAKFETRVPGSPGPIATPQP